MDLVKKGEFLYKWRTQLSLQQLNSLDKLDHIEKLISRRYCLSKSSCTIFSQSRRKLKLNWKEKNTALNNL